jgi:MFS family permease
MFSSTMEFFNESAGNFPQTTFSNLVFLLRQFPPMLLLVLASLAAHVALVGARITTSLYALSLHASTFTVGILIALFALFPMLFAVPIGRWVDRVGLQRPMRIGAIIMATGCAIPSLIDGLAVLYFSVLLIGSGFLAIHIPVQHAVGAFSTNATRAKHFSWMGMGYSASSFIGPIVAGYLIDHTRHGISFAVLTGFVLTSILLQMSKQLTGMQLQHVEPVKDEQKGSIIDLLRNRELLNVYVVGICLASAWDLFMFVMPIHGTRMGLSASSIGLILGAFSASTFTVRLGMQYISRHFSEWQILTGSLGFSVICYLLFPFMTSTLSLLLLTIALGLALGSSQPNVLSLLHHNAPPGRAGEAVGVRITIGNASQVALPLAFGAAGATLGLFPVFWAMGALIGIGVPIAWRKSRQK